MTARSKPRSHKIPTVRSLENIALFYLSRYAASEASLRRVLENRIRRAAYRNPEFAGDEAKQDQLRSAIKAIIERHTKTGILNDVAYAEMKTNSLRRAGRSARAIKQRLGRSGIASRIVDDTLTHARDNESGDDAEIKAALILARRRKLGPYRTGDADRERKQKELATLARAGFSIDVARKVLNLSIDDLEGDPTFS